MTQIHINILKLLEKENLSYAVRVFPIWATTNLTAKTNFPLESGYFDIVIIDEASQCDVPSALPLLYRGKQIIIIGDPNQLRHVATLSNDLDQELATKFQIGISSFSYNTHSLYDIAQRSIGTKPGALLLNEHYRSDARIIEFSNQEFYDGQLTIKTDLSLRNISKSFLNNYGGIFWLHVDGKTEHPVGGSAYNEKEINAIQKVVPRLQKSLQGQNMGKSSLGIVTPYRAQKDRLEKWITSVYGEDNQVIVGTAHTFQGDERDFIIFSPVISKGISEGSINWLQRSKNLLNVAITRARIAIIIIGDIEYCLSLPSEHAFRHLAEYVFQRPGLVVDKIDQLPLFGHKSFNVVGVITDQHNPEYNRTTLRRFIASCKDYVWWVDPYFNSHVFDLLRDVFQDENVNIKELNS